MILKNSWKIYVTVSDARMAGQVDYNLAKEELLFFK